MFQLFVDSAQPIFLYCVIAALALLSSMLHCCYLIFINFCIPIDVVEFSLPFYLKFIATYTVDCNKLKWSSLD